jgi:hypothetical protein
MEPIKCTPPAAPAKRGRPRKQWLLADGCTPLDPPTFARIKALQAAGHTSRSVAEALQLELALINTVFGTPLFPQRRS